MTNDEIRIVEITKGEKYKKYLHRCLVGPISKKYKKRMEYLEKAIPNGFHKKLLIVNGTVVGTIEYAPAEFSYYPITGSNVIVINCIWVLRKVKGHRYGNFLLANMIKSERNASGFAIIALENHWSPWFKKGQLEKLGFKPLEHIRVKHKIKKKDQTFKIYLMWMPKKFESKPPKWNTQKLLEGLTFCTAHPLYHPQTCHQKQILEQC